jgi:RNA polymerase sigma-70 factor (ECF subfamily)
VGQEDRELVRAAQQGAGPEAEAAFAALLDRWQVPVLRFVGRRVRSAHDAEDLAAETFVEAWRSLPGLRDPGRFPGWILQIAWRRVVRHYEARGVRVQLTLLEKEMLEQRASYAPPDVRDDLRDAFGSMPPEQMRLLLDKYEGHMTYGEIASRDGVSVSTVRDRLVAARDGLSRVLQRAGLLDRFAREMEERRRRRRHGGPGGSPGGGVAPLPGAGSGHADPDGVARG